MENIEPVEIKKTVFVEISLNRLKKYHTLGRRVKKAIKLIEQRNKLKCVMIGCNPFGTPLRTNTITFELLLTSI